jgi:DNA replication protein DnaC
VVSPEEPFTPSCRFYWLINRHNLAITGPTAVGKSYLSVALEISAICAGYQMRYYKLLEKVGIARADGTYPQLASTLARTHLLILGEWGILRYRRLALGIAKGACGFGFTEAI